MIEAKLQNGKPLPSYKHINAVSLPETPAYTVKVDTEIVFYYDKAQKYMGWSRMSDKVKFDPFPKAADASILAPDLETIIKLEFEDDKIIAMADCAGGPMTAPCMVVLREDREGTYKLHLWNEQTNSYFQGRYDLDIGRALTLFTERVIYERKLAKDLGLPPIRVWFFHSLLGEGLITEFAQLRRWA